MESRKGERIIVLVDMDCFYVQVEQKLCPEYQNRPCAVVQYNTWKGGGIIAVNYEARAKGVSKRHNRGEDAQKLCPDIHLFRVPEVRGKADLTRYREAGASVMEVLCKFSDCVERASIDEAYLDMTEAVKLRMQNCHTVSAEQIPNSFIVGWKDTDNETGGVESWLKTINEEDHLYHDRMLSVVAVMVEEMRVSVFTETGYRCSAGIAHNKMLAKLVCGLHKPNKQTVLPESSVSLLYKTIPINKVRNLGGKFGEQVMETFKAKTMSDLLNLPKSQFTANFGEKSGNWLYDLSRGIENELVTPRQLPKSIGCGKNFPGKSSLSTKEKVSHWVKQLASELEERLLKDQENNCRVAKLLTVTVRNQVTPGYSTVSRSCPIPVYSADRIFHDAFTSLQKFNTSPSSSSAWTPAILSLAMSAGKFEDRIDNSTCDIQSYFSNKKSPQKKDNATPQQSTSNIDTLVDLLDAEPLLVKQPESVKTQHDSGLKKSTQSPRGISSFFSVKTPSSSSSSKQIDVKPNNSFTTLSNFNDGPVSTDLLESSTIVDSDNQQPRFTEEQHESNDTRFKVKGFFARKLEEKTKIPSSESTSTVEKDSTFETNCNMPSCSTTTQQPSNSCNEMELTNSILSNSDSTSTVLDPELTQLCVKCNQQIPIWEEEEHADFHMALDMSKEFVKVTPVHKVGNNLAASRPQTKSSKTSRKRGRLAKPSNKGKRPSQQNTIDSFFK